MLEALHDKENKVVAYIEWALINGMGEIDDKGEYCWVKELWVHYEKNIRTAMDAFTRRIINIAPTIKYVYFQRYEKYGQDSWKTINAENFLRRINGRNKDRNFTSPHYTSTIGK